MIATQSVMDGIHALAWALLHTSWQGLVVAALYFAAMRVTHRPQVRYSVGYGALVSIPICFTVTWLYLWIGMDSTQVLSLAVPIVETSYSVELVVVLLWTCGVLVMAGRGLGGWYYLYIAASQPCCGLDNHWSEVAFSFAKKLGVRRAIALKGSRVAATPLLVGWVNPVILVPISLAAGAPPECIRAVLAHELIHMKRQDYLLNIVQSIVESVFFFHPAVWWLSAQIRQQREYCCDDQAVKLLLDKKAYTRALAQLVELRFRSTQLAVSTAGSPMIKRIHRLVIGEPPTPARTAAWYLALFLVMAVCTPVALVLYACGDPAVSVEGNFSQSPAFSPTVQGQNRLQGRMVSPVSGGRVTFTFGDKIHPLSNKPYFHRGLDIAHKLGTPISAPLDATVSEIDSVGADARGRFVVLEHGNGFETRYYHMEKVAVDLGDTIPVGHIIGTVGTSGKSTGPHLHVETLESGQPVDPALYFSDL